MITLTAVRNSQVKGIAMVTDTSKTHAPSLQIHLKSIGNRLTVTRYFLNPFFGKNILKSW